MEALAVIGTICSVIAALGLMASGVWLIATMRSDVKHVLNKLTNLDDKLAHHAKECDKDRLKLNTRLSNVEGRLEIDPPMDIAPQTPL